MAALFRAGWLGSRLGGKRLGTLMMALMAVMPMVVSYSQEVRTYSLFLAASLASFGCLLAWRQTGWHRWAIAYLLATVVMGYSHYYWVFNVLAQQCYLGWQVARRRIGLGQWLAVSAGIWMGLLPWL